MLRIGLTGGIASGKSTVAAMLREAGFKVIDADSISHKLMEPGQAAHDELLRQFGAELAGPDARIDRAKLAAIVFADPAKLAKLNSILHPLVDREIFRQFDEWERRGSDEAAFVEAALLVEAGIAKNLDKLIVAWCRPEQQLERLLARGTSQVEAARRIAAQLPLEEKLRHSTDSIDCSGTLESTRRQVEAFVEKIRGGATPTA